jgi:conserved oligomeric Golgi complex subunit 3
VPRVVTDMKDARIELDERLRGVIGDLVSSWSGRMTGAIAPGAAGSRAANGDDSPTVRGRPQTVTRKSSATGGQAGDDDAGTALRVRQAVEREVPLVRRKMDEYIHDRRTRDMLLRAVLEDVLVKYAAWLESRGLGGGRSRKGKGREDTVWEEDAFREWALGAFGLLDGDADADGEGFDLE